MEKRSRMRLRDGLKGVGAAVLVLAFTGAALAAERSTAIEAVKSDVEDGLGLSAAQKERITAVREDYKARQQELKNALALKNEALRQELDSDAPVRANVDAIVVEIKAIQGQITDNHVDVVLKLRAIYTAEQIRRIKLRLEQQRKAVAAKKHVKKTKKPEAAEDTAGK